MILLISNVHETIKSGGLHLAFCWHRPSFWTKPKHGSSDCSKKANRSKMTQTGRICFGIEPSLCSMLETTQQLHQKYSRSTDGQILAHVLAHPSHLPVILDQQIETSHLIVRADRGVRPNDIHHLSRLPQDGVREGERTRCVIHCNPTSADLFTQNKKSANTR